jgi:hypothetical protein
MDHCVNPQCKKYVKNTERALKCDTCHRWEHFSHTQIPDQFYEEMGRNDHIVFKCSGCKSNPAIGKLDLVLSMQAEQMTALSAAVASLVVVQEKALKVSADAEAERKQAKADAERERKRIREYEEEQRLVMEETQKEDEAKARIKDNLVITGSDLASIGNSPANRFQNFLNLLEMGGVVPAEWENKIRMVNDNCMIVTLNAVVRERILTNRRKLKGKNLYVNEDKTYKERVVAFDLRSRCKTLRADNPARPFFVRNGIIMTKDRENGPPYAFRADSM